MSEILHTGRYSHAVVYRRDWVALPPHQCLLNRVQHNFLLLSQPHFTYQLPISAGRLTLTARRSLRDEIKTTYAWTSTEPTVSNRVLLVWDLSLNQMTQFQNLQRGKKSDFFLLMTVNRLFIKFSVRQSHRFFGLRCGRCVSCKFDEETSPILSSIGISVVSLSGRKSG